MSKTVAIWPSLSMSTFATLHTDMTNLIQQHTLIYQKNKILCWRTTIQTICSWWDAYFIDKLLQIKGNDKTQFNQLSNSNLAFTLLFWQTSRSVTNRNIKPRVIKTSEKSLLRVNRSNMIHWVTSLRKTYHGLKRREKQQITGNAYEEGCPILSTRFYRKK